MFSWDSYQNIQECVGPFCNCTGKFYVSSINSCGNICVLTWYITVVNTLQVLTNSFSIERTLQRSS